MGTTMYLIGGGIRTRLINIIYSKLGFSLRL